MDPRGAGRPAPADVYVSSLLIVGGDGVSPAINRLHGQVVKGVGHLGHDDAMEAGGREFSLHGRVVKGVGHLDHDEAMEAGGHEFSLHGQVVKGV